METITAEDDTERRKAAIAKKLSEETDFFTLINAKVKRAEGLDANLNRQKADSVGRIDKLLDKYNVIDLEVIPTIDEEDVPSNIVRGDQ